MAAMKTVLVSYNGSSKVFRLTREEGDEFDSLKRQCRTMFKFGANVELQIVFQKYDPDWDHLVDVDEDSCFLEDKDKLHMVVQPILIDKESGSEGRGGEVSSMELGGWVLFVHLERGGQVSSEACACIVYIVV